MINKLIQAFTGSGKDKVFIGDKKVDMPTTLEEAQELWGATKFVKMACQQQT